MNLQDGHKLIPWVTTLAIGFLLGMLSAEHAHAQSGNDYVVAQQQGTTVTAVVLQVRQVTVSPPASGQSRAVGGALGGAIAGYASRNANPMGRVLVATLGATGGVLAADHMARQQATEVVFRSLKSGNVYTVVQPNPAPMLAPGMPVLVLQSGGQIRLIPDQSAMQQPLQPANVLMQVAPATESSTPAGTTTITTTTTVQITNAQ